MLTIDPKEVSLGKMHGYLLGTVAPRPIAFASTINQDGNVNLSPFSFFNCFGSNPPILIFSPSRRGRDNTTKHTFENAKDVPEVVINIVNYAMVQQMSLASTEYPLGVNEFIKSGLTQVRSVRVKPPRVGESPASFECKVLQIVETGTEGGAGNLVICEILLAHINEEILDEEGRVDPNKLDAVARMGDDWYCRAKGEALFRVPKPVSKLGVGVVAIPNSIRISKVLTGNDLGLLGNIESIPNSDTVREYTDNEEIQSIIRKGEEAVHTKAHELLSEGRIEEAWKLLIASTAMPE
jgi:flavin reductase (DIM6/NTAB) family NADH-FMN oxidoreductase RutF